MERKFCAIDCEGDNGPRGLLGVSFYSDHGGIYLTEKNEIDRALAIHAYDGYTFVAHVARYDLPILHGQLGLPIEITSYGDRFHHGSWKYDRGKPAAQFWCTYELSGGLSLKDLGDSLGCPKYPTPHHLRGIDPDKYAWRCETHNQWECEECYAVRDAEISYRYITALQATLQGWGVKSHPSLPRTAVDVWQMLDRPGDVRLSSRRHVLLARKAYYGGRSETFKLGLLPQVHMADISSAYPAAMAETPMPVPSTLIYRECSGIKSLPEYGEGVAEVTVIVPPMYVPPLPHTKRGERLYPIGRIRGTWTLLDLRYAVSIGCEVTAVHQILYSTELCYPFSQFVDTLWILRKEYERQNDARALVAKTLHNALYGRLGCREETEREIIGDIPFPYDSAKDKPGTSIVTEGEHFMRRRVTKFRFTGESVNVLWAAQITAAVRVKLHTQMLALVDALVYCGTDMVLSLKPIPGLGDNLGQWGDEGIYEQALIVGPGEYAVQARKEDMSDEWWQEPCEPHGVRACDECRWRPRAKGISRSVAMDFLRGESVTWQKAVTPKEALGTDLVASTWIPITKHRSTEVRRRQPTDPAHLYSGTAWSDTVPPYAD